MNETDPTELIREAMPLCATLGVAAEHVDPEQVVLTLEWSPALCTTGGMLHGGVLMALADSAGGALAHANLPERAGGTATIESKTNFLGAVREGVVRATAVPLHVGTSVIVVETGVTCSERLVAKVTQTQAIL